MTTDPNTHVDLLDKDGNIIGSGTTDSTGHATITPTVPIPEGNVTVKATDNAEHQIVLRLILLKQLIQRHQLFQHLIQIWVVKLVLKHLLR